MQTNPDKDAVMNREHEILRQNQQPKQDDKIWSFPKWVVLLGFGILGFVVIAFAIANAIK